MRMRHLAWIFALALAGCAIGPQIGAMPRRMWQPPPGAQPAQLSATPMTLPSSSMIVVNGQPMETNAALNWLHDDHALILGQIQPGTNPVPGQVRIVIPDHDRLRVIGGQLAARRGGTADFFAEEERLALHLAADVTVRSRAFESATVVEQNDTVAPDPAGADYLLWFQVQSLKPDNAGPWLGRWQFRRASGGPTTSPNPDLGTPAGPQRYLSLVKSIQLAATNMRAGRLIAGGNAPAPVPGSRAVSGGTGIVIDSQGHVLTNDHVIANCPDVRIAGIGNATVVSNDATVDLALLQTGHRSASWARFRDSSGLRPGETIVVTGFPLTGLVSPEMAVTTGSVTTASGGAGNPDRFQFSAPVQPGNSGGPVIDETGRVVGIASSELNGLVMAAVTGALPQNVNFGIKSDAARDFTARNAVALDEGARRGVLNPAAIGDLARKFTVKVECFR